MVIRVPFGELIRTRKGDLGRIGAELEVLGQAVDITLGDDDPRVATAVAGALAAVVVDFCICHGQDFIATRRFSARYRGVATKTS